MKKPNIIFIAGAPGSGKTTVAELLVQKLHSPYIDFGWLREFHLDREWKKANDREERMSFENLVVILKNYIKYSYKNVIVTDLRDSKIQEISKFFKKDKYVIFTLIIDTDEEMKKRVLGPRDSGFKNVKEAISWNKHLKERKNLLHEIKIDNSHNKPEKTVEQILKFIV